MATVDGSYGRVRIDLLGHDVVHRQEEFQLTGLRVLQDVAGEVELIFLNQRFAHLLVHRFQECVSHASADDERIDLVQQILDDSNLVADLCAPEKCDERPLGMVKRTAEIFQFFFHQQAGGGSLNEFRNADS